MENPWLTFNPKGNAPKFHDLDRAHALAFNKGLEGHSEYKLAEHLEPYPYLGNPDANIFVLLANPWMSKRESDPSFQLNLENVNRNQRNLRHESADSFLSWMHSPDNPEREGEWLIPRIRKVVHETSLERVSSGLFLINYHPYNSESWYPIPFTFETQRYSFHLVSEAMKRNALIIMSRNMLGWFTAIPGLYEYKNRFKFKSSRSVHISPGNLGSEAYKDLLMRL
jgi:hypothetical protein